MKKHTGLTIGVIVVIAIAIFFAVRSKNSPPAVDSDWQTVNQPDGITFQYPADLDTTYINTVDWPPQARVIDGPLNCTEAGEETERAGKTEVRTINGRPYCVTTVTEGAAGSIYSQYAYATAHGNNKTLILTFTLRAPQCGNYDDPQKTACEQEKAAFNIDPIIDQIVSTI